jgi:hypothetical protein
MNTRAWGGLGGKWILKVGCYNHKRYLRVMLQHDPSVQQVQLYKEHNNKTVTIRMK